MARYHALGRRIEKKDVVDSNNTVRYYHGKDWQVLVEYNGSGIPKRLYIYGNYIDEVLYMYDVSGGNNFFVHDHLYSPVALVDMSGNVKERYEYDAYGNFYVLEPNFAPDPDGKSDYGNPYLFTGRRVDILNNSSLKIQYNRNRYYDYYTGRWLTQDPLGIMPHLKEQSGFDVKQQYDRGLTQASFGITPYPEELSEFAPIEQYKDGMNLYEYATSDPIGYSDALGTTLETCAGVEQYSRGPLVWWLPIPHFGLYVDGWDTDFGPASAGGAFTGQCPFNGAAGATGRTVVKYWHGRLEAGPKKGQCCKCVSCADIKACIRAVCTQWDGSLYIFGIRDCYSFRETAKEKCCLYVGYWT